MTSGPAIEWLEFGKLCGRSGFIRSRAEYRTLGVSDGFPRSLQALCQPLDGLSIGDARAWSERRQLVDIPHGAAVRPAILHGRVLPVAYRLQLRFETAGRDRLYWRGQYLIAQQVLSPARWYAALQARALSPIDALPLRTAPQPMPPVSSLPEAPREPVLRAVVALTSGVPVALVPMVPEPLYFAFAQAVWELLPESLRPWLGIGWGVTPGEAVALGLACTWSAPPTHGAIELATERWRPPERPLLRPARGELADDLTLPGRMYYRQAVRPERLAGEVRLLMEGIGPRPPTTPPVFHHAFSGPVARAFQRAGIRCLDSVRLARLRRWLREGGEAPRGAISGRGYYSREAAQRAAEVGLAALADRESRPRGDRVVWEALRQEGPDGLRGRLTDRDEAGCARAWFLIALHARSSDPFARLSELHRRGEADPPTGDVCSALEDWLDETLGRQSAARSHLEALRARIPAYDAWACRRSPELIPLLACLDRTERRAASECLERLEQRRSACILLLRSEYDPEIQWDSEEKDTLQELVRRLWSRDELEARSAALAWARRAGLRLPGAVGHLLAGRALSEREVMELAADPSLPPELDPVLSAEALRGWWTREISPRQMPERLIRFWPEGVQHLLAGRRFPGVSTPPIVQRAAEEMSIPLDQLTPFIHRLSAEPTPGERSLYRQLARWVSRAGPAGAGFVAPELSLMRALFDGEWPKDTNVYLPTHRAVAICREAIGLGIELDLDTLQSRARTDWQRDLVIRVRGDQDSAAGCAPRGGGGESSSRSPH